MWERTTARMRILVLEDRARLAVRELDATLSGVSMDEYREALAPQLIAWREIDGLREALATDRPYPEGDTSRLCIDEPIFGTHNPPDPDKCLYQYTRAMTLPKIRANRSLKFRALKQMNDPQEALFTIAFQTGVMGPAGSSLVLTREDADAFQARDWAFEINVARSNIKIGSYCMDTVPDLLDVDVDIAETVVPRRLAAHRGYAHPRMWAQYGDATRGVCLVLDQDRLMDAVETAVGGRWSWGYDSVTYTSGQFGQSLGFFDARDLLRIGPLQSVLNNADQALFTKHSDWADEAEFRVFVASDLPEDEDLYIPIQPGVIVGLVLGPQFDPRHLRHVWAFARDFEILGRVRAISWTTGIVGLTWMCQPPSALRRRTHRT